MGENSKIEWTTHTFNPHRGCTKVSAGCANCYADRLSKQNPSLLGIWGDRGTRVVASEAKWREPLKWDRAAKAVGERHRVFCASFADVFEDWQGPMVNARGSRLGKWHDQHPWADCNGGEIVEGNGFRALTLDDVRARLFLLIRDTPNLDWLLLTKRPENVLRMTYDAWCHRVPGHVSQNEGDGRNWKWPANVWLGTSVENQAAADERIPHLLKVPAAVRFLSMEPLLELVDLDDWLWPYGNSGRDMPLDLPTEFLHWVIVGGESGPKARPMHPDWARSIRDQCQAAGVPFFFKQWGEWVPDGQSIPFLRDVLGGRGAHESRALYPDGSHLPDLTGRGRNGQDAIVVRRVGKKGAGRTLDGRTWDEVPAGKAVAHA